MTIIENGKVVAFAAVGSGADEVAAPKVVAYAATGTDADELYLPKLVVYAIIGPPPTIGVLRILTWTFSLDDHDFLVIQLADTTLVHDFLTGKWHTWGSGISSDGWQTVLGQNWNADLGAIMPDLGGFAQSNVVCGDGETGALYFLDPELPEDYSPEGAANQPFSRVITGQLVMRGHSYVSCPAVEITGSTGDSVAGLTDGSVSLLVSDNKGHSYWSAGSITPDVGVFDVTLSWRSLGSFTGPGRMFRITDYGALERVDGMDIPDGS